MKLSDKLKQQRADLDARITELFDKTQTEQRDFDKSERDAFDAAKAEREKLLQQIADAETAEDARRNAQPAPNVRRIRELAPGEVRAFTREERMFTATANAEPLSLGRLVRAMSMGGDRSQAPAEYRALGEAAGAGGTVLVPLELWGSVVDRARNASVMVRSGSLSFPMSSQTLTVAKLLTDPIASFRNEAQAINETDPTFGPLVFTAHSLGCLVRVSNELLADAVDGGAAIENSIAQAVALAMDGAGLTGDGVAPNPLGLFNTGGVGSIVMGGGPDGAAPVNYNTWIKAMGVCRSANEVPTTAIMSARTQTDLDELLNTLGDAMEPPAAWTGLQKLMTNAIPDDLTQGASAAMCSESLVGDFTKCAYGIRQNALLEVTNTGGTGTFAQVQTLIRMTARLDFHALRPAAFTKITGILKAA